MEEFEIVRSGDEITKLSVEKDNELIEERERVELLRTEIELLRREKNEQENAFSIFRANLKESLLECHETIQQFMKESAQKDETERELKEKLSKYLEENATNEIQMSSLRKNLREIEDKVNENKKNMIEKETQIMKLKIELAISRDMASWRGEYLEKEIAELQRQKEKVQTWSADFARENQELRASKENVETELRRVVLRYQKSVLSDFLQKAKRLALPPSESSKDSNRERVAKYFIDKPSLESENANLKMVNSQLKQQLREAQFELNNMEISDFLIMIENQTDHAYFNNQSLQRKDLLKQNIQGLLTGIRQLCDHRNISMEFTI